MNKPFIFGKKKEGIKEPTLTKEQLQSMIKDAAQYIIPFPNNDVEFIAPMFSARKHYNHLKKMMWKYRK